MIIYGSQTRLPYSLPFKRGEVNAQVISCIGTRAGVDNEYAAQPGVGMDPVRESSQKNNNEEYIVKLAHEVNKDELFDFSDPILTLSKMESVTQTAVVNY
ncbi:hypothetical protein E2C01_077257 [Portunus trituberculatus]|uniref:Uncharacterized protein n=1 Tax=Portunus trituberculatus TaxID=210409 RepID=A0A5B7IJV6_PORTR|nr:hypothetical protein [Portunus trituberculatus]